MKQLLFFFLLITSVINAQDFSRVDAIVKSYPRYTSSQKLVETINKDFNSDSNKVRAAFIWLTQNIRYDLKAFYQPKKVVEFSYFTEEERLQKIQTIKDNIVEKAFLTKMGVCEEYAQSFKKLADLLGIEAQVLKGYVRSSAYDIGRVPNTTNHAWNAVKINGKWILLDATWAAGYLFNGQWKKEYNEYFFDIDSEKIGRTHYVDNRKWKVVLNQSSLSDFYNQPIYSQGFLKTNLELISSKKGVIAINRSKKIIVKIKNLPQSAQLYYTFKGQRYSKEPVITFEENTAVITIENPRKNTELYLFFNRDLALEYKIIMQ
tara:strand:+ start:5367 stop:6323 length:957 start_codon:yes stop_codon:yes gene_type:complete